MDKSLVDQERELKDLIRRAKANPDRTGVLRRDTLRRLIQSTRSTHASLKTIAAGHIRFFFTDFPDLEEEAINAVYDLCEDQQDEVRIEGYAAITQVSKAAHKWVKRNADVLLQLLQSDEPREIVVVKKALLSHLDMDPRVTLGVLCDQIVPISETSQLSEEEKETRDKLRPLVITFLTNDARRAIVERHAKPGSPSEKILVDTVVTAMSQLPVHSVEPVIKDLLVYLPCYSPSKPKSQLQYGTFTPAGSNLLHAVLEQAGSQLRNELRNSKPGSLATLSTVLPYLDLAKYITLEKGVASDLDLLQFWFRFLSGKGMLPKIREDMRVEVVIHLAMLLDAACPGVYDHNVKDAPKAGFGGDTDQRLGTIRKQVVDGIPYLLEVLMQWGSAKIQMPDTCAILLESCLWRTETTNWSIPSDIVNSIEGSSFRALSHKNERIRNIIRAIVQHYQRQQQKQPTRDRMEAVGSHTSSQDIPDDREQLLMPTAVATNSAIATSRPSPFPYQAVERDSRPLKRRRPGDDGGLEAGATSDVTNTPANDDVGKPSLLSRIGVSPTRSDDGRTSLAPAPLSPHAGRNSTPTHLGPTSTSTHNVIINTSRRRFQQHGGADTQVAPPGTVIGFSIKGAASAERAMDVGAVQNGGEKQNGTTLAHPSNMYLKGGQTRNSLLARLDSGPHDYGNISINEYAAQSVLGGAAGSGHDGSAEERGRRKRGRL